MAIHRKIICQRMIVLGMVMLMASTVSAQPVPGGARLKDLANQAGILIGVRTLRVNAEYNTIVEREFNTGTITYYPRWEYAYTGIGQYDYTNFNNSVNWLNDRQMKPMAHLLFGPDQYDQPWVISTTSPSGLDAIMQDRIKSIMESNDNKSKINVWNVVNETLQWDKNDGTYFPVSDGTTNTNWTNMGWEDDLSGLTGVDKVNSRHPVYIRKAFTYAAQYAQGKLELRDNTIEGQSVKSRAFYQLVKHLKNSGVKLDGVGMQCHFNLESYNVLDSAALTVEVQKYRALGLEVYFDEVDIGTTTGTWSDQLAETQKQAYKKLMTIALLTGVRQVHFWGLRDNDDSGWRMGEHPLLFGADNIAKPAYYGVQEALQEYVDAKKVVGLNQGFTNGKTIRGSERIRGGTSPRFLVNGRTASKVAGIVPMASGFFCDKALCGGKIRETSR